MADQRVRPLDAEVRAVEYGAHAFRQDDGSFVVRSESRDGIRWRVTYEAVRWADGPWAIRFRCECESGAFRSADLVPCWHAALVARRLEREGWARWERGVWWPTGLALDAMERHGRDAERPTIDLWDRDVFR